MNLDSKVMSAETILSFLKAMLNRKSSGGLSPCPGPAFYQID